MQQAAVRESWHKLQQEEMPLDGETVRIEHSAFDLGGIQGLFDADPATMVRTAYANPAVIVVQFPHPRPIRGIRLTTASMDFELTVSTTGPAGSKEWDRVYRDLAWDPTVELTWPEESVDQIRLEIHRMDVEEPDHVHIRDLKFL